MAVTENQPITRQDGDKASYPVLASTQIYQGTMVFLVAASGYADDDDAAGANAFGGIAIGEADNSSGANGDVDVECWAEGTFVLTGSGFTQAAVGDLIYASDNYTITLTSSSNRLVGRCVEFISATELAVKIQVSND